MTIDFSRKYFSPAKVNLFFRVFNKRLDGYHEIGSLMQAISLGDTLTFHPSNVDSLTATDSSIPTDNTNLIYKALSLFRKLTAIEQPFHIHLEKNIPIQAGLGGGSSNAATTLWALNEFFKRPLSIDQLIHSSAEIGSDVPFFFSSGLSVSSGRGEKIEEFTADLSAEKIWIAKPSFGLSTPLVYKHCKPNAISKDSLEECLASFQIQAPLFVNDLEYSAFLLEPRLTKVKSDLLDLGFSQVWMTGSGTAFVCLGAIQSPVIEGMIFYPCTFLKRCQNEWFTTSF